MDTADPSRDRFGLKHTDAWVVEQEAAKAAAQQATRRPLKGGGRAGSGPQHGGPGRAWRMPRAGWLVACLLAVGLAWSVGSSRGWFGAVEAPPPVLEEPVGDGAVDEGANPVIVPDVEPSPEEPAPEVSEPNPPERGPGEISVPPVVPPREAVLIERVQPAYPPLARQARIEGMVVLEAVISATGTVSNVSVVSGSPMLAEAAMEAVRQWLYEPATDRSGEAVATSLRVNVNFTLDGR